MLTISLECTAEWLTSNDCCTDIFFDQNYSLSNILKSENRRGLNILYSNSYRLLKNGKLNIRWPDIKSRGYTLVNRFNE